MKQAQQQKQKQSSRPQFPEVPHIDLTSMVIPPFQQQSRSSLSTHESIKSILKVKPKKDTDLESVPSLASLNSESSSSFASSVSFDPRILVCEFARQREELRTTWYSGEELDCFKRQALDRVTRYNNTTELVPTGTGRMVHTQKKQKALFTHKALTLDGEGDDEAVLQLAKHELANILVVDPHDMCLRLFQKAIKRMLPYSNIILCKTAKEAYSKLARNKIDMVVVEERLKHCFGGEHSGSHFIQQLVSQFSNTTLFVGVSAHFQKDSAKLKQAGADAVWPKPPPPMNLQLRNSLLTQILKKRSKEELIRLHL